MQVHLEETNGEEQLGHEYQNDYSEDQESEEEDNAVSSIRKQLNQQKADVGKMRSPTKYDKALNPYIDKKRLV